MNDLQTQLYAHNPQRRLFSLPVQQSWAAIGVYEQLLAAHRHNIWWVAEIGTGSGALSLYWKTWTEMRIRRVPFVTIDVNAPPDVAWIALRTCFVKGDCFDEDVQSHLPDEVRSASPGLLFLDGGDKPRELATFAPLVASGSLVLVHDYTEAKDMKDFRRAIESGLGIVDLHSPLPEIFHDDVKSVDCVEYYQPWHDQSIGLGTKTAILRRK